MHYKDAYSLVRGNLTIIGHVETQVTFTIRAPFANCITNIDGTTADDAEGLDLVMPIFNLVE